MERQPVWHHLKTWPEQFAAVLAGTKPLEMRPNDRNFQVGDFLVLEEWDPATERYSGRVITRRVVCVLANEQFGVKPGFCAMGMELV